MTPAVRLVAILAVTATARPAWATETEALPSPPAAAAITKARAKPRLAWNPAWPRFRAWEYAGTIVVGGTSLYLHYHRTLPTVPSWQGGNPFDDTVRGWLRGGSRADRQRASDLSDIFQYYAPIITYLADVPVILAVDRDVRLAWEILMMDMEANAVTGFITNTLFMTAGRARPLYASCAADPSYDLLCGGSGVNASFPSGHTLTVGTAAGLMCVHHHYLPIYGHPLADDGACAVMVLATLTTAVAHVVSDRHWASDTLFGAAVGFGTGYGLPWVLHYRARSGGDGRAGGDDDRQDQGQLAVVPFGDQRAIGLVMLGVI
jgi:membrane-associated phospholipid phosphatase